MFIVNASYCKNFPIVAFHSNEHKWKYVGSIKMCTITFMINYLFFRVFGAH